MSKPNHYAVMGVQRSAPYSEIKTAYNHLALAHHPDKGGQQAVFIKIQNAWEVLRDYAKRAEFVRKYPTATGVPGKPQLGDEPTHSFGSFKPGAFPKKSPFFDQPQFREPAPSGPWSGYRESSGGNAYNSHYGFASSTTDKGSPKSRPKYPKPADASRNRQDTSRPPPEPKDTPMTESSEVPKAEQASRGEQRRNEVPKDPSDKTRGRGSTSTDEDDFYFDSDPYPSGWSPPPVHPRAINVRAARDLTGRAQLTLKRYNSLVETLRATANTLLPREILSPEIIIKLSHVRCNLTNREMRLHVCVLETEAYNRSLRDDFPTTPLEPFFETLEESLLSTDKDDVTKLENGVHRIVKTTMGVLRVGVSGADAKRSIKEARANLDLEQSIAMLEILLAEVLRTTPVASWTSSR